MEKERKMHALTPKVKSRSERVHTPNAKSNESINVDNNSAEKLNENDKS